MRKLLAILVISFMPACAQLGVAPATTFNENLAYAYGTVTTIRTTATTALNAKQITADDGQHVLQITDQARTTLDSARIVAKTDLTGAQGKLNLATGVLAEVQKFLTSKGAK